MVRFTKSQKALLLLLIAAGCEGSDRLQGRLSAAEAYTLEPEVPVSAFGPAVVARLMGERHPFASEAIQIKFRADAANFADLQQLKEAIPAALAARNERVIREVMQADLVRLAALKAQLDRGVGAARGSPALRSSLDKLIGTKKVSGFMSDAIDLLAQHRWERALEQHLADGAEHTAGIAVLKLLLSYSTMVTAPQRWDDLTKTLDLLYPAKIPAEAVDAARDIRLFQMVGDQPTLLIPNSGYIFGGDFFGEQNRGMDCSAFLGKATHSTAKIRLTTMVMEFAWRELHGDDFSVDDPDGAIRRDLAGYGLVEAKLDYLAIDARSIADLEVGDLVVWRLSEAGGGRAGHVVMYLGPDSDPARFISVETNRDDGKTFDGFIFRRKRWERPGAQRFVLRRKR
jgi:cell wall-associated NlpC family hydrolase